MAKMLLDGVGLVVNEIRAFAEIKKRSSFASKMSDVAIRSYINKNYVKEVFYFDEEYYEMPDETNAKWKLVNCGIADNSNEPIYFQFSKSGLSWSGALVGTLDEIIEHQSQKDNEKYSFHYLNGVVKEYDFEIEGEKEEVKNQVDIFLNSLHSRLLNPSSWENKTSLMEYINSIMHRLNYMIDNNMPISNVLVYNNDRTKAYFNSYLLDKFGKKILIVTDCFPSGEIAYNKVSIVESRAMLVNSGFDKAILSVELDRVVFYDNSIRELIFDATIEDFDLDNYSRLTHCIVERRDRFPEEIRNYSDDLLYSELIKSVETGINLSKYDSSYVKPFYSIKHNKIHFVIPFHSGNTLRGKPELGIVVAKFNNTGLWQIMTVLDYNMVLRNTKILFPFNGETFLN